MIPVSEESNDDATFPIVLAHNDAQENNILMKLDNNRDLLIIDYEYAGWNPMAMDLANYLNESMLDNSYPAGNGIGWYIENCMTTGELREMTQAYLTTYFEKFMLPKVKARYQDCADFIARELDNLLVQVLTCARMNNFFWGVWALALLTPQECAKPGIFNYDFALARIEMDAKIAGMQSAFTGES